MSPSTSRAGAVVRARAAVAECLSGQLSLHEPRRRAGATSCPQMYVSGRSVPWRLPWLASQGLRSVCNASARSFLRCGRSIPPTYVSARLLPLNRRCTHACIPP